jgi:hypothetical protein
MKYRKLPIVVEATQWFKNGDHPKDDCFRPFEDTGKIPVEAREGKIVRYYRDPYISGQSICRHCLSIMHVHGWIDTFEGGHIVCPGDWVITGIKGEIYPCRPDIFEKTYEAVLTEKQNLTVKEITEKYLRENGFDGLCDLENDCGCFLSDFMPCGENPTRCQAAYKDKYRKLLRLTKEE